MPDILTAATFDKNTAGLSALAATTSPRVFLFAGETVGAGCFIEYTDDLAVTHVLEGGDIGQLPASLTVTVNTDLQIRTLGTPIFNLVVS